MFAGDIFASQRQLSSLLKGNKPCDAEVVNEIGAMIRKFTCDTFIPVEYSEKLLTTTGNLMEKCTEEESMEFASSQNFTDALIGIVDDFNKRIVPTQSSHNQSSFSSHYCYELALFMLLGLLDKSSLLIAFVKTATVNRINECLQAICSTILHDHLYLTQEVGLEIICRVCHYFLQKGPSALKEVIAGISPMFRSAVDDPKKIYSLLRDMRPFLNEINASNPGVFSLPMRCFSVGTNWKKVDTQRDVHMDGWMDLCKNDVCYNLLEKEVLLRFRYQSIKKIHFSDETNAVQVLLHECPKKLKDLLRKDELPPPGQSPVLVFEFASTDKETMQNVRAVLESRMIEHETVKEDGQKYSVVSSRDQSPNAVAQALDKLRRSEGIKTSTAGPNFVSPKSRSSSTAQRIQAAEKQQEAARHEESPSSISSPDMEVPSVNTSQEHLKDHKPGPDSLLNLTKPSTATMRKPVRAAQDTSAQAAGRKRQITTDVLAQLPVAKKRATSAAAPPALETVKKKAARSPVPAPDSSSSEEHKRAKTKAKTSPPAKTTSAKGASAGRKKALGSAAAKDKENVVSAKSTAHALPSAFEADDFGFDAGDAPGEKEDMILLPALKTPLRALTSSDLNARASAAADLNARASAAADLNARASAAAESVPRSTARMRTPAPGKPPAPPAPATAPKSYSSAQVLQDSPAVSQAGTHSSKRKFGRVIEPVMDEGVAWMSVDLPPSPDKSHAQQQPTSSKKGGQLFTSKKVQPKPVQSAAKRKGLPTDPPQSEQKAALLPQSNSKTARMHSAPRVLDREAPSPVMHPPAQAAKKDKPIRQHEPKRHAETAQANEGFYHQPPEEQQDAPYYDDAGFAADDVPYQYDAVADTSFAAASSSKMLSPNAPDPEERDEEETWRRPGPAPVAKQAASIHPVVSSMASQLEASRAALKLAVSGKLPSSSPDDDAAMEEAMPKSQPAATFTQGLADTWRAASQVSLTSRATGSAYHTQEDEDRLADAPAAAKRPSRAAASPVAPVANTRRSHRKRAAAEMDSDEKEEETVYARGKSRQALADHSGSEEDPSGSSLEENDVVAALLREIIAMQKERAKRKRAHMLASIGSTAKTQVVSFLGQWQAFAEHSCGEMQRGVNAQLEHLCATADTLCEALRKDAELFASRDQEMGQDLHVLEKEATALKAELGSAQSQCRNEEAKARNDVAALRGRALDAAKKTLSMHKDIRHHSSKLQSMELLKALRET